MSNEEPKEKLEVGSVLWTDLTVQNAKEIKDFYSKVIGWKSAPVSMGEYNDYNMNSPTTGRTTAGICHTRGVNSNLPPVWLVYFTVEDVDESAKKCVENGGKIIFGPKNMGNQARYCVIEDPAGASAALFSPIE